MMPNSIIMRLAVTAALTIFASAVVVAVPGDLDLTFGAGGRVFTEVPLTQCFPSIGSMVLQPDGRFIVSGFGGNPNQGLCPYPNPGFSIRYMPDGTLDPTFGEGGKILFSDGTLFGALLPDGKLLMSRPERLIRLLSDGRPDPSFGQDGVSEVVFPYSVWYNVKPLSDGKILVAADLETSYAIKRLKADGTLDTTFGKDGVVTVGGQTSWTRPVLSLTTNENFLLLGDRDGYGVMARYDPNGDPDPSFGDEGRIDLGPGFYWDSVIQADGKVVILFERLDEGMQLIRYNDDGSRDDSFANGGAVSLAPFRMFPNHVVHARDGKLVVSGNRSDTLSFAAVRFLADGTVDSSFGAGGIASHAMNAGASEIFYPGPAAMTTEGRLIIAGRFSHMSSTPTTIALAGLITAEDSGAISGRVLTPNGQGLRSATVTLMDSSGKRRNTLSSSSGYFSFEGLPTGEYTLTSQSRRYRFSPRAVTVDSATALIEIVGVE
jgi:uncharacterized delta-60 repeat protein